MKTTISLLAACLCMAYSLVAQPVYDGCAAPPQPGEMWMTQSVFADNPNSVMPGPSGTNVVWDFSNWLGSNATASIDTYYTASSLPQAAAFPASNLAAQNGVRTRFLSYSSYAIQICGIYYPAYNQSDYYTDLITVMECPMNYQDAFDDTFTYVYDTSMILTGNKHTTYDAYGTLILPWNTYQNAIRIHSLDTVFNFGVYEAYDTYQWIETTNFRTVLRISRNHIVGDSIYNATAFHSTHTLMGTHQTAKTSPLPEVELYPNPVLDQVHIQGDGLENGQITLSNLTSQVILRAAIHSQQADIGDLATGMYLYSVEDALGQVLKTGKLVKQ